MTGVFCVFQASDDKFLIRFVQTWLPGGIQGSSGEALSFGETDGEGSGRSNDGPDVHSLRREVCCCQGLGQYPINTLYHTFSILGFNYGLMNLQ